MRIDRSWLTDAPGEDHMVRRDRSALDNADTAGKDECKAVPDQDTPAEVTAADKPTKVAKPDAPAGSMRPGGPLK
jgi:hypothetical protein